ncbi:hypothetical protein VDR81_14490 [Xanthomonas campestris pv. campestris]|uniref:hypothetical protein n=1 Tax=Xanthomonas arboricola TaxID=56448 RepID=UPI000A55A6FE|nr:hypothetical protein [Xanthomonas arboricola]MEB1100767.1 hypothetical protein [Xanthomonas campestris pv. campestris]MEB1940268.1 hypothetical protein [Xanthomonas campestris pv. campestris]MEB2038337.1 hypothetical protein [Xanthomonas campestris pv. campestris]MEB2060020.1 hypothetical protein [Xanthomonas campestris pv. campestris]
MSSKFLPVDPNVLTQSLLRRQPIAKNAASQSLSQNARDRLLAISGVSGYGFSGDNELVVYVEADRAIGQLPKKIDGLKVKAELTGAIKALTGL